VEIVRHHRSSPALRRPGYLLAALLCAQLTLGAITIWSGKAVSPTTFHVAIGGLMLVVAVRVSLQASRLGAYEERSGESFAIAGAARV
jgi:heme A synthase